MAPITRSATRLWAACRLPGSRRGRARGRRTFSALNIDLAAGVERGWRASPSGSGAQLAGPSPAAALLVRPGAYQREARAEYERSRGREWGTEAGGSGRS